MSAGFKTVSPPCAIAGLGAAIMTAAIAPAAANLKITGKRIVQSRFLVRNGVYRTPRRICLRPLQGVQIHVLVHRHRFQSHPIKRNIENLLLPVLGKAAAEVGLELVYEQRQSFITAPAMADGILDR